MGLRPRIARPCTIQGYAYVILPRAFRMQGGTCVAKPNG
jgi:hypothetical protein